METRADRPCGLSCLPRHLGIALGAESDPREIVRRSVLNDEAGKPAVASEYCFTERTRTETLGQDGQVRAVSERTRDMCAAEFQRRRERFRKAIREIPDAFLFRLRAWNRSIPVRPS